MKRRISGRQNNSSRYLVDRISNLPDSILDNILSFLPTKDAVATFILSKRWKFVWRTVHNLDFCFEFERWDQGEYLNFVQFVNHVLLLHDSGLLNKFRLVWTHNFILSQACSWISTAVRKNVHELFVSVAAFQIVEMPPCVFKCDSLRSLELHGHNISVSISDEIVFCLPRLKSLKFVSVYFCSEEAFEQLINGCPVLDYLHLCIDVIDHGSDFTYIISSTSLRRLDLYFRYKTNLKLEASSLEYLKIQGYVSNIFVHKSLNSLVEAEFRIDHNLHISDVYDCNSLVEAVHALDCAKALTLSADVMLALNFATVRLSTEFKRLTRLNIEAYCCFRGLLQELIQSSNNLEVLTVEKDSNWLCSSDFLFHSHWTEHVQVPRCLSNSLKKVVLNGYYGNDDERKMVCYILMHGSALEVMMISVDSQREDKKFELLQEICEFSRKSPVCKVNFFG